MHLCAHSTEELKNFKNSRNEPAALTCLRWMKTLSTDKQSETHPKMVYFCNTLIFFLQKVKEEEC